MEIGKPIRQHNKRTVPIYELIMEREENKERETLREIYRLTIAAQSGNALKVCEMVREFCRERLREK